MPSYAYVARDARGAVHSGTREAESREALIQDLRREGLTPGEIRPARRARARAGAAGFTFLTRVKLSDLAIFCRQFSTMIDAGVSIVRCLTVLESQTQNARLRGIIADIREQVEEGQTLTASLERHPRVFSELFIGLVHAGEVGGVLEENLQRLSVFLEKDLELRRRVRAAMTYPIIVVCFATCVVIGLVTFVFPKFMQVFKDLEVKEFPKLTTMVMAFSNFLTHKGYWLVGGIILFIIAYRMFSRTRFGKRLMDRVKLKAPVIGKLNHKIVLARFSRTLGTLLDSGVPILQAMETVAGTVANSVVGDAVLEARARIREGDRIGDPLEQSRLFPPMVVHMIAIGEESGSLDAMLSKVADFYESEVDTAIQSLTSIIEPVLIVFLGVTVGCVVLSVFMPMVSLITQMQQQSM
jgi:type IV pilus assembly protein PilC